MAGDMLESRCNGKAIADRDDCLNNIPVWLENGVRNGILEGFLTVEAGKETCVVCCKDACDGGGIFGPSEELVEEAYDAQHTLAFGAKGSRVMAVDRACATCESGTVFRTQYPSASPFQCNGRAIATCSECRSGKYVYQSIWIHMEGDIG